MALSKSLNLPTGIIVESAYMRIGMVQGNKNGLSITVDAYKDQQAYADGKAELHRMYYNFVPSVEEGASNFIQQGYEHLRTLPEFVDSVDA